MKWGLNFSDNSTKMFSIHITLNYTLILLVKCTLLVSLKEKKRSYWCRIITQDGEDSWIQWLLESITYQLNPSVSVCTPLVAGSARVKGECLAYLGVISSNTKREEGTEGRKRAASKECTNKTIIMREPETHPARELKEPE